MRDRSRMSPEDAVFSSDERTLQQRYEDVQAERDALEVQVFELRSLVSRIVFGASTPEEVAAELVAVNPKPTQPRARVRRPVSGTVVYYAAIDGYVKIGVTSSLAQRMRTLGVRGRNLLAVEAGDASTEHQRHQEFADLRYGGTELFRWSPELRTHVSALHAATPDPWASGCAITDPAAALL